MQDEPEVAPAIAFILQDYGDVLVGLSRMDDERDIGQARGPDMRAEHRLLHVPRRAIIEVIQPRLADPDHLGVVCQRSDS